MPASSWASMRDSTAPQEVLYKPRGQQHAHRPAPGADAFPSLSSAAVGTSSSSVASQGHQQTRRLPNNNSGSSSSSSSSSKKQSAHASPEARTQRQQQQQQQPGAPLVRRRSLSAPSLSGAASDGPQQQPFSAVAAAAAPRQPCSGSSSSRVRSSSADRSQRPPPPTQQGLQLLQECHPWCDAVLLHEVLHTFAGDVAAALEALEQMLPAEEARAPAGPGSSCGSSAGSSDSEQADASGVAVASQQLQALSLQPHQQQQPRQQGAQLSPDSTDTYQLLRGDAVRLSHKYRKASKRAATARARGDYAAAAQHAAEAMSLKQAADAAHAAAALKIEVANNSNNPDGLWELDLHGLHVAEALDALQDRVALLQDIASDLRKRAEVQDGPRSSRQAALTSLLLPYSSVLSWEQQLAALGQELRVIVGKGLHSSGGEASLPRVVEQWLQQRGYRYFWRGGCIGVQLRLAL